MIEADKRSDRVKSRERERELLSDLHSICQGKNGSYREKNHGKEDGRNLTNTIFEWSEKAAVIQSWWM